MWILWGVLLTLAQKKGYHKMGVLVWRLSIVAIIAYFALLIAFNAPEYMYMNAILFAFLNLVTIPFIDNTISTCAACGKRVYFKPLISDTCNHCGEVIYAAKKLLTVNC